MYFEARAEGLPPRGGAMTVVDVTTAWAVDAEPLPMDESARRFVSALDKGQRMGLMLALDLPIKKLEAEFLGSEVARQ